MQRRNFLRLAAALPLTTLLHGCGSGWNLGFGPVRGGSNGVGTSRDSLTTVLLSGRAVLPEGLAISGHKIASVFSESALPGDGRFSVKILSLGATLGIVLGPNGGPLLFGFLREGHSEISTRSTAEYLAFMAIGAGCSPDFVQSKFLQELSQPDKLVELERVVRDLVVTKGESWLDVLKAHSGDFKAALQRDTAAFRPVVTGKTRGAIVDPAAKKSGIVVESDGVGTTFATNFYRRRAMVFAERISFLTEKDANPVASYALLTPKPLSLSPVKGSTSALATIGDFLGGSRDYFSPVKSDAMSLPLAPGDARSTLYRLTAVGLGAFDGVLGRLTTEQRAVWQDVAMRSLVERGLISKARGLARG